MAQKFSLSNDNWDLHRRADRDRMRHNEKVKEAIKNNLSDIVSQEDIITADRGKIVKVPIRGLELPRIRFDPYDRERIGQGSGGTKKGDAIGRAPSDDQPAAGKKAGQEPGEDYYEAEVTVEEIAQLVFEDLSLPNLEDKGIKEIVSEHAVFDTITRRGLSGNLDRKRTLMEAYRRNIRQGSSNPWEIREEDKRFKNYEIVTEPQRNAVVIAMRDISGSMGEWEAYICRSFYYWMFQFLRTKYANTEIVFITCHTEAKEVNEQQFFSAGDSGGTRMSSAYTLALSLMEKRYNPREWNIYPFLFSDGYNWGDQECVELVRKMILQCNLIGYGEIASENWQKEETFAPLGQAYQSAFTSTPEVVLVKINEKEDVWPALKKFFSARPGADFEKK
jgi:sporulation protein YhbH